MHNLDQIVLGQFPLYPMPRFGAHAPLQETGQRYVVGREGIKFEVRRPWLHAVVSLHDDPRTGLPYGDCPADEIELLCGPIPREYGQRFHRQAMAAMPCETAAWVVWHADRRVFEYIELDVLDASPDRVHFQRPQLREGTWLVMDFHSHGRHQAFFSPQDDADDAGEVKLAGVLGNLDTASPSMELRACLMGAFAPLASVEVA
jgi:PRTRC genetic system protein A